MSVTPRDEGPTYDVRATPVITNRSVGGDQFITRGHCLHRGCGYVCEGENADRDIRLHTEKAKHPTTCRTELAGLHHSH